MKFMSQKGSVESDQLGIQRIVIGIVLAEAVSVYGLLITEVSGSIAYVIGFTLATWTCQAWVRTRFKKNLHRIPNSDFTSPAIVLPRHRVVHEYG